MGGPHFVQVQSKHPLPLYGFPPNYTPPNVAHTPDENVDNFAPIPIESQKANLIMHMSLNPWGRMKHPKTTI